jgi:hypothetical protein
MSEPDKRISAAEKVRQAVALPTAVRWLRETIAVVVWLLAIMHLFVFDISTFISGADSAFADIFKYRLLIFLGIFATSWLLLGNRRFIVFFAYIIGYPFVLTLWMLPRAFVRNWAVFIAFSPAAHAIVSTFRMNFALFTAALISIFVTCLPHSPALIATAMGFLGAYLVVHYARRLRIAFSPSTVFADVGQIVRKTWDQFYTSKMLMPPIDLDRDSPEYKQKFATNLLTVYMVATVLHFLGERLKEVVKSRKLDLYFTASLLYTFLLTAIVFGIEYFGLERLAPGSFSGLSDPTVLDFLGYSFSTLMTSDISPLKATSGVAQSLAYLQLFGSLLIIVLLVFVILTSIRERYRQDLDGVVDELAAASARAGNLLQANYDLTIAAAEALLLRTQPLSTKWILQLRYGAKRATEMYASRRAITEEDKPEVTSSSEKEMSLSVKSRVD